MDEEQKFEVVEEFRAFYSESEKDKKFRGSIGSRHKRVYLFHGVGGTGKSSLIVALANHYNLNICYVDLKMSDPNNMEVILLDLPKPPIVVHENIRASMFQGFKSESKQEGFLMNNLFKLLDSLTSRRGFISIMTTNDLPELQGSSSELIYEGRVDKMIELEYITEEQVAKMFCRITGSTNQNLSPELAADFDQFFHGKKIIH
ncbi:hypothetical protein ACHAO8_011417 [Botrytis cinerea]